MTCRYCGCSDLNPCPGGCEWIEPELCSGCAAAILGFMTVIAEYAQSSTAAYQTPESQRWSKAVNGCLSEASRRLSLLPEKPLIQAVQG